MRIVTRVYLDRPLDCHSDSNYLAIHREGIDDGFFSCGDHRRIKSMEFEPDSTDLVVRFEDDSWHRAAGRTSMLIVSGRHIVAWEHEEAARGKPAGEE